MRQWQGKYTRELNHNSKLESYTYGQIPLLIKSGVLRNHGAAITDASYNLFAEDSAEDGEFSSPLLPGLEINVIIICESAPREPSLLVGEIW